MRKIKILSVSFENFKGFEKKEVLLDQYQAIVLAGKNGFGKTTVFDAIELVFTGKIKRYDSYLAFHRQNTSLSQSILPLVYDNKIPQILVSVKLQVEEDYVTLYRVEHTKAITNPIHFDRVFNVLNIQYKKNGKTIDEVYNGQFGLNDFLTSYTFLNYVSQEETTSFLKSKETDRAKQINELFNTSQIDKQLSKIGVIDKKLKDTAKVLKSQISDLAHELSEMEKGEEGQVCEYVRLVAEKEIDWDKENIQLSYEKFNSLLCESGTLDQLIYFYHHQVNYTKWVANKKIDDLLSSPLFLNFPYYLLLQPQQNHYKLYDVFVTKLLPAVNRVTVDNLVDTISPILENELVGEVSLDKVEEIKTAFQNIQPVGRSASILSKTLAGLQNERKKFKAVFDKSYTILNLTKCPLCGQDYKQNDVLKEKIDNYERVLSEAYPELQQGLGRLMKELRELLTSLVESFQTKFKEWNLTEEGYDKFKEIDFDKYTSYQKEITKFGDISFDSSKTAEDYFRFLRQRLNNAKQDIDNSLDYLELEKTYTSLAKFMHPEDLTLENIEKKRNYLLAQWNSIKSKLYKQKEDQKRKIEKKKDFCDQKIQNLKDLKTDLVDYKNAYLEKVISDIEILFYVYSGRIMQDNYYGRGLFIKNETSPQRVLFVSDYKSDVDALYNLSSGQLVSIVFAFVMALNKLYSSQQLIAIDDPVQTIDDINVWGFIETIRHAFKESFILLSTHEDEYAALLRYKFGKIGIPAKCIDMAEIRNLQE